MGDKTINYFSNDLHVNHVKLQSDTCGKMCNVAQLSKMDNVGRSMLVLKISLKKSMLTRKNLEIYVSKLSILGSFTTILMINLNGLPTINSGMKIGVVLLVMSDPCFHPTGFTLLLLTCVTL